jgi:hypothetical protein
MIERQIQRDRSDESFVDDAVSLPCTLAGSPAEHDPAVATARCSLPEPAAAVLNHRPAEDALNHWDASTWLRLTRRFRLTRRLRFRRRFLRSRVRDVVQLVVTPNTVSRTGAAHPLAAPIRPQQNVEVVTAERMPMLAVTLVGVFGRERH